MTEVHKANLVRVHGPLMLSLAILNVTIDDCEVAIRKLQEITDKMARDGGLTLIMASREKQDE